MSRRFVLVDRDGTINEELSPEYVLEPGQLRLIPGAAGARRRAPRAARPRARRRGEQASSR